MNAHANKHNQTIEIWFFFSRRNIRAGNLFSEMDFLQLFAWRHGHDANDANDAHSLYIFHWFFFSFPIFYSSIKYSSHWILLYWKCWNSSKRCSCLTVRKKDSVRQCHQRLMRQVTSISNRNHCTATSILDYITFDSCKNVQKKQNP